jgi:two-component system invasion response regulator UvrY
MREMLEERLEKELGMTVVATASDGDEAVTQARELKPDIVLMDIDMPGLVSFEAAKTIKTLSPRTRIVYLSAFFHDRYIEDALAAHAVGYVTKDESPDVVVKTLLKATSGIAYFSPKVRSRIVIDTNGPRLSQCYPHQHSGLSCASSRHCLQ